MLDSMYAMRHLDCLTRAYPKQAINFIRRFSLPQVIFWASHFSLSLQLSEQYQQLFFPKNLY